MWTAHRVYFTNLSKTYAQCPSVATLIIRGHLIIKWCSDSYTSCCAVVANAV